MDDDENNNLDLTGIAPLSDDEELDRYPRAGGCIYIGDGKKAKSYAWGLIWGYSDGDPANQTMKTSRVSALAQAKKNHADLYCVPVKGMYALGSTTLGHSKGMKPIATVIRDSGGQIGSDCLMAFHIEGYGYYVLGIDREGHILADTDILIDDAMTAKDYFMDLQNHAAWKNLRAPDEWGIAGSKVENFELVINSSRSSCKLRETSNAGLYKNLIILGGVCVVLGAGYFAWTQWEAHVESVQAQKAQAARTLKTRQMKEMAVKKMQNQGWPFDKHLMGVPAMLMCNKAMMETSVLLPEYTLKNMVCTPNEGTVTVNFKPVSSSTPFVFVKQYVNLQSDRHPHIRHSKDGVSVIYSYPEIFGGTQNDKYRFGIHDKTGKVDDVFSYLDEYANSTRGRVVFSGKTFQPPPIAPGHKKDQLAEEQVVFKTLTFSFVTNYTPDNFVEALAPVPILTISSVTFEPTKNLWSISGMVYESLLQSDIDKSSAQAAKK